MKREKPDPSHLWFDYRMVRLMERTYEWRAGRQAASGSRIEASSRRWKAKSSMALKRRYRKPGAIVRIDVPAAASMCGIGWVSYRIIPKLT